MQTTTLLAYPEYLLSGIVGLLLVLLSFRQEGTVRAPYWVADPARACLLCGPERYVAWVTGSLIKADYRNSSNLGDFACFKIYLPVLSLCLLAVLPSYAVWTIALVLFLAPDLVLFFCVKQRQREILNSLPQALDLMVLCVDAGLGLDATLQRIATESTIARALNTELNILGREILLGMDRERAYLELYNRTGVDELKILGSALNQANKLGLSIARILRAQSEFIRQRQSQKAEEKAMKLPIYMVFPLWFFIMPALMVLVLGPSLIQFFRHF